MRSTALLVVILCIPVFFVYAASERIVLSDIDIDSAPVQKLTADLRQTELGFRMAGIEVTATIATNGQGYQAVTPITSFPEKFGETGEEGLPELPLCSQLVAIPDQAGVRLEVISAQYEVLENYDIIPSQPSTPEGSNEISAFTKNEEFYKQNAFYPLEPVTLGEPVICRDLRMVQTVIYPVQYNPATRQLRVYTHIDYRLSYEGTDIRNAKVRTNNRISETFLPIYRALVPNADEMLADYQPVRGGYLILTPTDFADSVQALARWKHLKGYNTQITTDTQIPGGPAPANVLSYIQNAYNTWENPPEFVCIIGDESSSDYEEIEDFPYENYYASDHPYSCVDGSDYLSDVMISRMSIANMTDFRAAMYKAIIYESNPFMGDPAYWQRGLSVAGNVTSGGSPTVSPRLVTLWVRQELLRRGFTHVDTSFVWGSGQSDPLLAGYFNSGVSFISYRGWASATGWYAPSFDVTNLHNLQQNNKMGIMASLVCGTGNFGYSECFGEKWLRMGSPPSLLKGGPGFYGVSDGDTHTKWNNPIMIGYYWAILDEGIYNFASAAFMGKMEDYNTFPRHLQPGGWVEQYFHTYNTLGDPELELRTAIPQSMTVTYPSTIPVGTSMLSVHVNGDGGSPLADAYVNLVKGYGAGEEVFVGGRTNSAGDITLDFSTAVAETMYVTVTARNYIPHRGYTLVQSQSVALNVSAVAISDDNSGGSSGNNDGNVNPSETVEFAVTLRNFGSSVTATNVSATLASTDVDVNITVPTRVYPNIAPGAIGNANQFAAHFAADMPQGEHRILQLNITCDQGSWTAAVPVDIKSTSFAVTGLSYPGNPNNRFDPGETSQLVVNLTNHGELAGTTLVGHLSSSDTAVVITDSLADFGNIGIGGSGSNTASPFSVQVRPNVYHGRNVNFGMEMVSSNGSIAHKTFSAVIGEVNNYDPLGPDYYGYYMYDNTDVGCLPSPVYSWSEISPFAGGSGTRVTFPFSTDDDATVITLPFNFVYYGQSFNYMLVSINGFVAFDTARYDMQGHRWSCFHNGQIPESEAPAGLIGPFWDDLEYTGNNGVFRYYDSANHRFIIEWKNCFHPLSATSTESFQMIIYDPAYNPTPTGDAEIVFQYETVTNDDDDNHDSGQAPGLYSTVGMQNLSKTDGLQYTYDNLYHPAAAILGAGRAIKITTATGIAPPPDISCTPTSFFKTVQAGQTVTDTLTVANTGSGGLAFTIVEVTDNRLSTNSGANGVASQPQNPVGIEAVDCKPLDMGMPIYPPSLFNQGGPDIYGNHWIDSDEPGGPAYIWADISGSGIPITGLTDDNYQGPFNIGFSFPLYGVDYNAIYVSSNGIITFGSSGDSYSNQNIPNSAPPNNLVALFWDDLNFEVGGTAYYRSDMANGRFIISYINVPIWAPPDSGSGSLNFQAILYPSGRILIQYAVLDPGTRTLTSNTIGIENAAGSDGLQVSYNNAYLHNNMAILFLPPSRWLYANMHGAVLGASTDTFAVITFDATELDAGVYTGHLDLDSNDPDEGNIDIPLTLTVGSQGAPDIVFYPASLLDSLPEGQFTTQIFKVYNRGTANLRVNLSAVEFNLEDGENGPIQIASIKDEASETPQDIQNTWFFISPAADTIPPGDSTVATITFDARFVGTGTYLGEIRMASNDPDSPNRSAQATLVVFGSGPECNYVPGDINGNGSANGIDVTYGVTYLKGGSAPHDTCFNCPNPGDKLLAPMDVNGSCSANGIDITFFVAYLKQLQPALLYCEDCPPVSSGPVVLRQIESEEKPDKVISEPIKGKKPIAPIQHPVLKPRGKIEASD